ncbi:hypothetical protein [Dyadobacter sp. CY312]|uniref:hypothetical protein n=1 Tax=Dyadobacter sp. CY312 TaxID=2907303 RepID=UPI001F2BC4E9|nr:hypothetical protein [Dyadobacter sp. CY312]MCE7043551.1 hypothetical protein [Dyadobacter sp. CY312]
MKRNDALWKGILENITDDFLRFFFAEADTLFSLEKGFQFLDKELEQLYPADDIQAPKFVDKLVKVFTKSGKEEWILVHVEVQGYDDDNFAQRMFTYFYRILDKYRKPVTAIAIFTDSNRKSRPTFFEYDYLGTKATFQFNTYKVIEQDEETLVNDTNPFSIVILTVLLALKKKNLSDEELYNLKYKLAKNLLRKQISKRKVDDLLIFLQRYVSFADPEYNIKFERVIEVLTENQRTMGIRELVLDMAKKEGIALGEKKGIEKGREEGKADVIKNLLAIGKFSTMEIANFTNVTPSFVLEVEKSLKK